MTWDYWICLYTQTHCTARGLRSQTIAAYAATLRQFREYVKTRQGDLEPAAVTARHVLEYVAYLRSERDNGDAAVNRQVTVLKNFYRAMVAMGHLEPRANPLAHFPKMKAKARKLPIVLSTEEVERLLAEPKPDTVLGLRDRAILALLYATGIRASECGGLKEEDVDLVDCHIRVTGKGGHERTIPLNTGVVESLEVYRRVRGPVEPESAFFRSRSRRGLSRGAVYERVRTHAQRSGIRKRVSPHRLRHTFATHLMQRKTDLVAIRDLLGHRCITSTQIYIHVTAADLVEAVARHPIAQLAPAVEHLLPNVKLPLQRRPQRSGTG